MNLHKFAKVRIYGAFVWLPTILFATALASLCGSTFAFAQVAGAEMKREYFIRQGADEVLLIRINANEAAIRSNVYAPERRLLLPSTTNSNRITPLFQFIDSSGKDRQLDIEVASNQFTANSQFEIGITRLRVWDGRSKALARAYSLLSFGMQSTEADTAARWTVRINSLMGAADTFSQFGMTELKLWSTWLATNLVQSQLNDNNMTLGLLKEIQATTRASQWQEIDLAAQQTKSAALVGLKEQGGAITPEAVQEQLLITAAQAQVMGYRVTQAQMFYQSGLQYVAQSDDTNGLQKYQQALAIAEDLSASGLVKMIRESMADIHAEQGDDQATAQVLRQLETQLALEGSDSDELALNLLQQGRIFMRIWKFPQAIEVLQQALGFENNSSIASQINRELAMASHETGQQQEALKYLQAAGISNSDAASYFANNDQSVSSDTSGFRRQAESSYQKARSLAHSGKRNQARQELDKLLDQVLFLRQSLSGVLGSWYWQRHEAIIDDYLALGVASDAESLLALSKSRFASKAPLLLADSNQLRNLLAQEGANNADAKTELARLRSRSDAYFGFLSIAGIESYLRLLSGAEVVLTYHLSPAGAYVWIADSRQIKMQRLAKPKQIIKRLEDSLNQLPEANLAKFESLMSALGNDLLLPVKSSLQKTIYLIPSGLTLSLPFDSLRLDQRFLIENHSVVNVLSFPAGTPASQFARPEFNKIFLAGDPLDFQAQYANQWQPSEPIKAVTDIFVGPGLNIIQGSALLQDEFQSETFQQSDLVHLSMSGDINLNNPDQSGLQLSEPLRDLGRMVLRPAILRTVPMQAELVYMADTNTNGQVISALSQQLGLVSDVLQNGSRAVVAQLSSTSDEAANAFLKNYYAELESTGNVAIALTNAKRAALNNQGNAGERTWSSLQIFTN